MRRGSEKVVKQTVVLSMGTKAVLFPGRGPGEISEHLRHLRTSVAARR